MVEVNKGTAKVLGSNAAGFAIAVYIKHMTTDGRCQQRPSPKLNPFHHLWHFLCF